MIAAHLVDPVCVCGGECHTLDGPRRNYDWRLGAASSLGDESFLAWWRCPARPGATRPTEEATNHKRACHSLACEAFGVPGFNLGCYSVARGTNGREYYRPVGRITAGSMTHLDPERLP